jgi:site-specific DNA recombinase
VRAIPYRRVSTEEQADSTLGTEAQGHSIRQWAAREGAELLTPGFLDDGLSGSLPPVKRPGLLDAVASLEKGDVLLVAKRDRICRGDAIAMATIENAVKKRGARIVSAAGEGTDGDDPSDILFRRLIDAFSEYELLLIRARTKNALAAQRRSGARAGQLPYGLRMAADDGRRSRVRKDGKGGLPIAVEIDPDELALIASIQEQSRGGTSCRAIARGLDAREVPTKRGGKWSESSVRSILSRESGS